MNTTLTGTKKAGEELLPSSSVIMGPAGTGKTSCLVTYLAAGLKLRLLATEPTAPNRILQECKRRGISDANFDWNYVSPSPAAWSTLIDKAKIINTMTLKDISDMRGGIAKSAGTQFIAFLETMNNFVGLRHGTSYGDVATWGDDTAFAIDGLSGFSEMSRNLTVGWKPNPSPGEWGVMQSSILDVIRKLCSDLRCFFTLIAHIEREQNEITGMTNITLSTLGAKLAPKLPPLFTNVVLAKRLGTTFHWSVADSNVDTKPGDLEFKADLPQDFTPIVNAYRERMKAVRAPAPTGTVVPLKP